VSRASPCRNLLPQVSRTQYLRIRHSRENPTRQFFRLEVSSRSSNALSRRRRISWLGCMDGDENLFVVDEHAERLWLPQRHAAAVRAMVGRHRIGDRAFELGDLRRIIAGG